MYSTVGPQREIKDFCFQWRRDNYQQHVVLASPCVVPLMSDHWLTREGITDLTTSDCVANGDVILWRSSIQPFRLIIQTYCPTFQTHFPDLVASRLLRHLVFPNIHTYSNIQSYLNIPSQPIISIPNMNHIFTPINVRSSTLNIQSSSPSPLSILPLHLSILPFGGRRSPAVVCWASDHWVASSNSLRGKFRH